MLRIRRSRDRLIFNMGVPLPGKDGIYIETGSGVSHSSSIAVTKWQHECFFFQYIKCWSFYSRIPRTAGRRPGYWSNLLVPEVTCPVTGRARPGVAPGKRRGTGPGAIGCPACATETGQHRRGSVAMTFCRPLDRRTTTGLVYPYRCSKSVNRPVVANHKADDGRHDAA